MKVLHLSAADYRTGAGIACMRLHKALVSEGVDSTILFLTEFKDGEVGILYYERGFFSKIRRLLSTFLDKSLVRFYRKKPGEFFSPGIFGLNISKIPEVLEADILHLHWINHGFISVTNLLNVSKPIIWTMHDCWTFTGGCHHFFKCDNYILNCGKCPVLNSSRNLDLSSFVLERKRRYIKEKNFKYVAISQWMKRSAERSSLLGSEVIEVIPSSIDTSVFKYLHKNTSLYVKWGISSDQDAVLLIGAQDLNSPYKGSKFIIDALNEFRSKKLTVLTFGSGQIEITNPFHNLINLGFVSDVHEMNELYNVADVFLSTSVAESFGMTVAEAQCSGTPVIVFNQTGSSDIVEHLSTGYLANFESISDVINGLDYCLSRVFDKEEISLRSQNKFSISSSARRYIELYNKELMCEERA